MKMASDSPQASQLAYAYTALDHSRAEIRLVRIHPKGNKTDNLYLFHSALSEIEGQYFALSYTWGNAKDKVAISLNGRRFEVTRDLATALVHLRRGDVRLHLRATVNCVARP